MGEHVDADIPRDHSDALLTPSAARGVEVIERFNAIYTDNASAVAAMDLEGVYDGELDIMRDGTPLADGALLRAKLVDTYLPVLSEAGLELSTLADPGFDRRGRRPQPDRAKPLALAVTIGDAKKFSAALDAMGEDKDADRLVRTILRQTVGVVRSDYDSENADLAASAERVLAIVSEVVPRLEARYPDYHNRFRGVKALATLTRYLQHHDAGTLEDYLGAEKRDIIVEDHDAHGPSDWGLDFSSEPLYSPEEFEQKWRTALDYMRELHDRQSPLFDQLYSGFRDQFDSSLAWLAEGAQRTEENTQKLTALQTLESLWSDYFAETDSMHQLGKEIEASRLAQYVIGFGLEPGQVPELSNDVDEVSVVAAQGLLRHQAQQAFDAGQHLPSHQGIDQFAIRQDPTTGMEYTIKNLPERAQLLWRKQRTGSLPVPQIEVRVTRSSHNETVLLEKDISYQAEGSNGLGMRLQAIVDDAGVRARIRNAHMAGQTHFNHWLSQAESIQAATAIMAHVEAEAAPWASQSV